MVSQPSPVYRIDFFAALSLATDFALGQTQQFALKASRLAVRIADSAGADDDDIRDVLHQALLRYVGCNADTYLISALLGDEYSLRREFALIDLGRPNEVIDVVLRALRHRNAGASPTAMVVAIAQGLVRAPAESRAILTGHCEVAERIALRLGLGERVQRSLGQLYERWDGRGIPHGLKGEAVALPVRIVTLAQDIVVLMEAYGADTARARIAKRMGGAYDPRLAELALDRFEMLLADLGTPVPIEEIRRMEPVPHSVLDDEAIDNACLVIADMADMRMPHTIGHSRAVADLASAAARRMALPDADIRLAYRAGLVHDIGEVSVPVSVWVRPGPVSEIEQEQIRLHPYHTEQIVRRAGGELRQVADAASRHHERLNGSGYFRGCHASELSPVCRVLAAAEMFCNAIEERPHRAAFRPEAAAAKLNAAIRDGRICAEAGAAVLEEAGQRPAGTRDYAVSGLTARELDVLRLLTAGNTARQIAVTLSIAPKTAANHVQNIYAKLGVSTRAAAVLFAVENGLHRYRK